MYMIFGIGNTLLIAGIWFAVANKFEIGNMKEQGIVPDLIPIAPKQVAGNNYGGIALNMGNELTPAQVKNPPTILKWIAEPGAYYTLLLVDPDISLVLSIKHLCWFVVNIPGNDVEKGDVIFDNIGSGPPKLVIDNMEKHGVIPDVISVAPKEIAEIKYGNVNVNLGDELTPTQVKDPPTTLKWTAEQEAYYTLIFTDPDIPPQANAKQVQHWLVVNIPGNDISKGHVIFNYFGSGPPKGTGIHRYVFAIFKQPEKMSQDDYSQYTDLSINDRKRFTLDEFVKKHKLGNPVSANYYRAQYDEHVPVIHAMLSKKYGDLKK